MPNTSSPTCSCGHGLADRLDVSGDFPAAHAVLRGAEPEPHEPYRVRQAGHDVPGAPVQPGRAYPHQNLVVGDGGPVDLLASRRTSSGSEP